MKRKNRSMLTVPLQHNILQIMLNRQRYPHQLRGAECTSSAKVLQNILPLTGSIFFIKWVSSSLIILSVIQSIWSRREATVMGMVLLSMALSMVPCTRISLFFCKTATEGERKRKKVESERKRGDMRLCEVGVKVTDCHNEGDIQ